MTNLKNNKLYFIILALIILVCLLFYEIVYESYFGNNIDRKLKHLLNFSWLFIVFVLGQIGIKHFKDWMKNLWKVAYAGVFILLILAGMADWLFGNKFGINYNLFFAGIRYFFSSPFPYLAIYFLEKKI